MNNHEEILKKTLRVIYVDDSHISYFVSWNGHKTLPNNSIIIYHFYNSSIYHLRIIYDQ